MPGAMASPQRPLTLPLLLATAGGLLEVVAGYWDVYSHRVVFVDEDPWWNPAHGALLAGGLLLVASVLLWRRRVSAGAPRLPGYGWVAAGAALQVMGAAFNELWHAFIGPDPPLSPPHVMVVVGMIAALFGVIVALAALRAGEAERGDLEERGWRLALPLLLVLAFAAMWLAVVGSFLFTGALFEGSAFRYGAALFLATVAPVIVVPGVRTFGRFGPLTLVGAVVADVNWLFLVGYVGVDPYVPYGLVPFLLADALYHPLGRRAGPLPAAVAVGGLLALLYNLTFFPFILGFPVAWPHAPDPSLLGILLAGGLGGLLGHLALGRTAAWAHRAYGSEPESPGRAERSWRTPK